MSGPAPREPGGDLRDEAERHLRALVGDRFAVIAAPGRQAGLYATHDGRLATSLIHAAADSALPAGCRSSAVATK